jgi:hypothetical protein
MERQQPRAFVVLIPAWPYAVSFFLPLGSHGGRVELGLSAFVVGTAAFPFWLPNPLMWLGLYLLDSGRYYTVLLVGSIASLLALADAFYFKDLIGAPAYQAWFLSMLLLVIAGYLGPLFPRPSNTVPSTMPVTDREFSDFFFRRCAPIMPMNGRRQISHGRGTNRARPCPAIPRSLLMSLNDLLGDRECRSPRPRSVSGTRIARRCSYIISYVLLLTASRRSG